jgi:hypothetical protein
MGHINGLHLLGLFVVVGIITVVVIARSPKAPQQPTVEDNDRSTDVIERHTSLFHRLVMATFVTNVMGYGNNSHHFAKFRGSVLCEFTAYAHLIDALENARRIHDIPARELSSAMKDNFVSALADDSAFVMNCARYVDFIAKLADDSYVISTPSGTPIPEEFIVRMPTINAYRALRDELWPGHDFDTAGA